jgi:hypothetical protein
LRISEVFVIGGESAIDEDEQLMKPSKTNMQERIYNPRQRKGNDKEELV